MGGGGDFTDVPWSTYAANTLREVMSGLESRPVTFYSVLKPVWINKPREEK